MKYFVCVSLFFLKKTMEHITSYFDLFDAYTILHILLLLTSKTDLCNAYGRIKDVFNVYATKITMG